MWKFYHTCPSRRDELQLPTNDRGFLQELAGFANRG